MNNQEQEKVTQVVKDIIVDRTTEMVENMSNHDFIEYVMDRLEEEGVKLDFENDEVQEEITDLVGKQVLPLLHKIMEWGIGKELPKLS
jgi:tetrahydromethanopterin S-methyltransferase subunit G